MRIQSPLSNLRDALKQVKETAQTNQIVLTNNEDATRAALIDPVLHALGWRTSEVSMVQVEKRVNYSSSTLRADYALYDRNGKERVVIEAKSPGQNLQQEWPKMISYASAFGVTTVFLTDGLVWHHFDTKNVNTANIVPTAKFDIAADDLVYMSVHLMQHLDAANFWPEEQSQDAVTQDINQLRSDVATLKQQITSLLKSNVSPAPTSIGLPSQGSWINLTSIVTKANKPNKLRLPNDQSIDVKYWRDILIECCKFALASTPNLSIPFKSRSNKTVDLFSTLQPANGISYVKEIYNGQDIFIYTNFDADNCVANVAFILQQVPPSLQVAAPAVIFK